MTTYLSKSQKDDSKKDQQTILKSSGLKSLTEKTIKEGSFFRSPITFIKNWMNSRKNKVLMTPSSKPILIMSELKKSLMAKKFISKLKKGFIGAILSKEQCILINDPSYDSVAPHIKKNSKLKKQLENSLEQKKKVKFSFQKKISLKIKSGLNFFFKILKPDEPFRVTIDLFSMLLIFYDAIQIPLVLSFDLILPESLDNLANFAQCFFLLDIYLNFQTAFYTKGTLIEKRKKIIKNYLRAWFWIDCLASFPYDWVMNVIDDENIGSSANMLRNAKLIRTIKFIKFIKVLRMLRLFKLKKILMKIENYVHLSNEINGLLIFLQLSFYVIVIAHWCACCWHFVATFEEDYPTSWLIECGLINSDWSEKYIGSLYWSITTMITVGYGDIVPKTSIERVFSIFVMLVASGMFAYTMNKIGSIFQNLDKSTQEYKEKMQCFDRYMISQQLPKEMISRIKKYLEYVLEPERTIRLDQTRLLQNLSDPLQKEVIQFINGKVLFKTDIFNLHFTKKLMIKLPFLLTENIYGPNETIYNEKDIFNEKAIYFITSGCVDLIAFSSNTIIKKLEKNHYFGEISFFSNISQHSCSVITSDFTSVFVLKKSNFSALFSDHELSQDQEVFCYLQQKIDLFDRFDGLGIYCYSCGKGNHIAKKCPDIHVIIKKIDVAEQTFVQSQQTKKNFKRKNLHNTNLNKNRKKGFHSRGDFLLIKDEVLVYRKFLSIFLKQIADENIKDNEKEPIKKHFPSFFNEGDIYETEDEKEFEFSIQDKMNFEIISYPIKNLCKISDRNKERKYDEKSSRKEKTTFISLTNKMRERNLNSLQININRSKTMLFNEITCLKNLDKIESFEIYFPLNNFGKVVEKINKKSELLLKKMKEKKDCKERKKKMLLDNLNNQPVSLTVRLENLKSTKKEKKEDLFFNSSNNLISTEIPKKPELKLSQSLKEFKLSIEKKKSNSTRIPRPEILKEAKLTQSLKEKDIYDDKRTLFLQNFEKMIKLEKEEVETNIKLSKTLREKKSNDKFIFSNDIEKKEDERNLITHALEDNEKKKIQLNSNKNNVQMRRSLSNDTMKNTIEELEKIIEKTNKIFGSVHAKYLVEQCQNFK